MKTIEMLNQIKTLLSIKVKLEEAKLENGTIISADSFEKGNEIFIVTDDKKVAMPVGEYILEDGRLLVVYEEGMIDEVKDAGGEVPSDEEASEDVTSDLEREADIVNWKALEERIQNLEDAIASIKDKKLEEDVEEDVEEDLSEDIKENVKEDLSKEDLSKEDLSKQNLSVKPIKHSPESGSQQTKKIEFARGKFSTPLERVLNRLNK